MLPQAIFIGFFYNEGSCYRSSILPCKGWSTCFRLAYDTDRM